VCVCVCVCVCVDVNRTECEERGAPSAFDVVLAWPGKREIELCRGHCSWVEPVEFVL
jgi:hypothetical protein